MSKKVVILSTSLRAGSNSQAMAEQFAAGAKAAGHDPLPSILTITTFSNHLEILNRTHSYQEAVFYMLYAAQQQLTTNELRRSIVS